VPWGTLLVDGRTTRLVPPEPVALAGSGPPAPTFVLGRGRHTIEDRAAPFLTLRCVVSVPAAPNDTCPLARPSPVDPVHAFGAARVLDLEARPERLPADALTSLQQILIAAMNAGVPPVRVAVGERYLGADGAVRVASQPLMATVIYAVNHDPTLGFPGPTGPCVALCGAYPRWRSSSTGQLAPHRAYRRDVALYAARRERGA
jgi:hypothetical protein